MTNDEDTRGFDCVQFMREVRERISREIAGMDHEQLLQWLDSQQYSDPRLTRLAARFREDRANERQGNRSPDPTTK